MKVDSKLLLGLVIGAAVGASVGYLAVSDKREQLFDDIKDAAGKVKDAFNSAVAKCKEKKACPASEEETEAPAE